MTVRERISQWEHKTYIEAFDENVQSGRYNDITALEFTKKALYAQGIANKYMDGNSTMRMNTTEREVGDFKYLNVFDAMTKMRQWSPVDMVYGTCYTAVRNPAFQEAAKRLNMSEETLVVKMCGRALRAMPSYLREHDLQEQIVKQFPNATLKQNKLLDTVLHADLLMEKDNKRYFFWSYVATENSLRNFNDKFLGHRKGSIPDGNHVVCPIDLANCDEKNGWKLYSEEYIKHLADIIEYGIPEKYCDSKIHIEKNKDYFATPKIVCKEKQEKQFARYEHDFDEIER